MTRRAVAIVFSQLIPATFIFGYAIYRTGWVQLYFAFNPFCIGGFQ